MSEIARVIAFPRRQVDGHLWEPWIDEAATARHFSVSTRTVRRWRRQGMPSKPIGGLRRYRLSECEAWHAAREGSSS